MPDFIVVGAGSAGAVVAGRLSSRTNANVLLLEAGLDRVPRESLIPAAFSKLFGTEADWAYHTAPGPGVAGRSLYWPRGRLLGGSSAMNAMIWTRGDRGDFDEWAELGNAGWSYRELAPLFAAAELNEGTAPGLEHLGITVSRLRTVNPLTETLLAAALAQGIPSNDGFQDGLMEGAGLFRVCQHRGQRVSTGTGYLEPVRRRQNLTLRCGVMVTELLLEGPRVVGVRFSAGGAAEEARGHVVLAAGAIGTPEILLRSGIGPAVELAAIGVRPRHDLPGVGKNLQDHLSIGTMFASRRPLSMASAERFDHVVNYLVRRRGPLTSNVAEAGAFIRIDPRATRPDMELIFAPNYFVDHGRGNPPGHGFTLAAILQRPASRGEIRLSSSGQGLVIQPNYLTEPEDLTRLLAGLRRAQEIAHQAEVAAIRGAEYLPGKGVDLEQFVRERSETLYHPVGTCRMGNDRLAVVNSELAVRGLTGITIADASVMPTITTGHPHAAVVAIGEAAATILGA